MQRDTPFGNVDEFPTVKQGICSYFEFSSAKHFIRAGGRLECGPKVGAAIEGISLDSVW